MKLTKNGRENIWSVKVGVQCDHSLSTLSYPLNFSRSPHHYTVDCTRANTGLFVGIFVMVLTIISVIVFFVLITSKEEALRHAAIMVASTTELSLYTLTTFAVLVGMFQVLYPFLHKCSIAALK